MLDSMRRNANSWIFMLIFGVLTFVFAVNFGPWAGNVGPRVSTFAAEVNGHIITLSEFEGAYGSITRNFQGLTEEQIKMFGIKERTLDSLIANELLAQLAEKNSLVVTDEELIARIKEGYLGGQALEPDVYERAIQSQFGISPGEFDRRERRKILAERMRKILETGVQVSESDVKMAFDLANEKIAIEYVMVNPNFFTNVDKLNPKELEAWALENEDDLRSEYAKQTGDKKYEEVRNELAENLYMQKQRIEVARKFAQSVLEEARASNDLKKVKRDGLVALKEGEQPQFGNVAPFLATTDLFSRTQNPAGLPRQVAMEAFKLSESSPMSNLVEANGSFYVARLKERKLPEDAEFELQKDMMKVRLASERRVEFVQNYIDYLKKNAKISVNNELLEMVRL